MKIPLKIPLRGEMVVVPALFLLALLPRLYRLGAQSFWLDEGSTWAEVTSKSWGRLLLELLDPSAGYPLYHLLMKAWVWLGESEAVLRLPSALAGALAVPAIYVLGRRLGGPAVGWGAALLALISPFAIWQSQDAKAYSLLILLVALSSLLLWDALEAGGRRRWLPALGALLLAGFVHRLGLLVGMGALLAILVLRRQALPQVWVRRLLALLLLGALALLAGVSLGIGREGARIPGSEVGALRALWLTPGRFALNRYMEIQDPRLWLLLPFLALLLLGLARLALASPRAAVPPPSRVSDQAGAGRERRAALFLLCAGGAPLLLFLLLLSAGMPYEPRYMSIVYPAFCLLLAWPLRHGAGRLRLASAALLLLCAGASLFALFERPRDGAGVAGLFSGEPVKEQFRHAIAYLGQKVHPDDVLIANPPSVAMLYRYYASRTPQVRWPEVQTIANLGSQHYDWREFDPDLDAILRGHTRAWLLEAPAHASLIDNYLGDQPIDRELLMGKLTINFRYAADHRKWACGELPWSEWLGLRVMCQAFPEAYQTGAIPQPERPLSARFGQDILLRGYTLKLDPAAPLVAGGTLPLTLFWLAGADLRGQSDYRIFLHLVRRVGEPPVAQEDTPPQLGGLPTSSWLRGDPIHDEHAVALPSALEPGRYSLLVGLYDPAIPDDPATPERVEGRLPIAASDAPAGDGFIELATLEVSRP